MSFVKGPFFKTTRCSYWWQLYFNSLCFVSSLAGLGPQFESCSEGFVDEEINGKALLTINAEYLTELSVSCKK
jgi:hypothetical protein